MQRTLGLQHFREWLIAKRRKGLARRVARRALTLDPAGAFTPGEDGAGTESTAFVTDAAWRRSSIAHWLKASLVGQEALSEYHAKLKRSGALELDYGGAVEVPPVAVEKDAMSLTQLLPWPRRVLQVVVSVRAALRGLRGAFKRIQSGADGRAALRQLLWKEEHPAVPDVKWDELDESSTDNGNGARAGTLARTSAGFRTLRLRCCYSC